MNKLTLILLPSITGAFFCLFNKFNLPAFAQVTTDGTTSTTVNADGNNFTINDGNIQEGNLFHSFQDFSVPNGGSAIFNNPTNITNIFSRVTGGNVSNINGLIGANGTANLFLINPAGILFGENASLDIGGSFYGTTADSILFEDGELNALDADNPPLLTVNAPIGLSFRDNPADIQLQETNLALQPRQTLAFFGGNINLQGGAIEAPNGQIQLGGLLTAGTITIEEDLSFAIPQDVTRADVLISDGTFVNAAADRGGNISIQSRNINSSGGDIFAGVFTAQANDESQGGTIRFDATESITLTDSSLIETSSFGQGNAGNIIINAQDSLTIDNQSTLAAISTTSQEQAGNVEITANNFTLNNNSLITTATTGAGNTGDIEITASSISLDNASIITNISFGTGNAGDININAEFLSLGNGSELVSSTLSEGNAGNIEVNASDSVTISGVAPVEVIQDPAGTASPGGFSSGLFSTSEAEATGQGGTVSVTTSKLSISDGATLSGRTRGSALGGNIVVNGDTIDLTGGGQILTTAFDTGDAGNITLNVANQINISGSDPTFSTRREQVIDLAGQIDSGQTSDLEQAIDPVSPESGIFASTGSNSTGSAGNIFIGGVTAADSSNLQLPDLNLANDGRIAVNSQGQGNGGNVSIQGNSLSLDNNAAILAGTPQGTGGNIDLDIQNNLTLRQESLISAAATNDADGGNIQIDSQYIVAFPDQNSDIIASAEQGNGGNINITAESLFGIEERPLNLITNDINASSQFGLDGSISIFTPDVDALQPDTELPGNLVEGEQTVAEACKRESIAENASNLVIKGKGGVPSQPTEPMVSDSILVDGEIISNSQLQSPEIKPIKTGIGDIYPARGIVKKENGEVVLTTYSTDEINTRTPQSRANCNQL